MHEMSSHPRGRAIRSMPLAARSGWRALTLAGAIAMAGAPGASAQDRQGPPYTADREGIPTSLFGTYVRDGEFLVYPFYEYTVNTSAEYTPSELGFPGETDFFGKQTENEFLIFFGYGISKRIAFEFEAAVWASAQFEKDANAPLVVPDSIEESGLGDVETEIRWVWAEETEKRPMLYSFFELVFPFQKNDVILGTQDWETALGFGFDRAYRWGVLDGRVALKYDAEDGQVEAGEYAIEYVKRTSERWRWVGSLEGEDDELSLI